MLLSVFGAWGMWEAAAGLNNLTGAEYGAVPTWLKVFYSVTDLQEQSEMQKKEGGEKKKEKRITVAAANNVVLASNTFYF